MTSVSTVFARRNDSGNFSILDNESGHPATRLDASVYPVGSDLGCRYEHAKGIVLTREDVIAAGIDFENPSDADEPAPPAPTAPKEFFVAVPGDDQASGIFGIGLTHEGALLDVTTRSGWTSPRVSRDEAGHWVVTTDDGADPAHFPEWEETAARDYAAQKGFVALPCTERLYLAVERNAAPSRWTTNAAGEEDLDVDQGAVDEALDEVKAGLDGEHYSTIDALKSEEALDDAHTYVDAFIGQDAESDYHDAIDDDPEFRLALDLAVRDHLLELIAECAERRAA